MADEKPSCKGCYRVMFYLVTGQRRGQRRRKGILEVVCEEDMHVDYVPVIQSSAFKPGGGSFQTVQSRT